MTTNFRERAIDALKKATEHDHKKEFQEAMELYMTGINWLQAAIKYEKNQTSKGKMKEWLNQYLTRAEKLKKFLNEEEPQKDETQPAEGGAAAKPKKSGKKGGGGGGDDDDDHDKMKKSLSSAIVGEKPNVKWDDVAGLEQAKGALKESVILPIRFPQLFTGNRKPWKGILMYGPPGTGKSYLAKAVATEADSTFFSLSSADLVSKWLGESEKQVRTMFEMAREQKPSIVFIDEIDSLASARSDNESESSRRIKTEFLVQMDGVGQGLDGVLILGATNLPWNIDSAILRRFQKRIYIPLPDFPGRRVMLDIRIGKTPVDLDKEQLDEIASKTDGYSGSDITNLVQDAIMGPVRRLQRATHFKQIAVDGKQKWTACSPGERGAEEKELMQIPADELEVPKVAMEDFLAALETTRPSVAAGDLAQFEEWTSKYGMDG
eukprot:CAMPEP_0113888584 /NCGR_PEP_ID=MMETSP0780_2-20120614/12949_1 /TAXON_ID=652834 /ORGANISM="Palpitomonas bilix" /LENGTH=434 /DNA_ID=CAMNT_0000877441 /DNA_START=52 /DNA_END=1356 /DNA_ORIENTATION=+ /assembly_acc=CAM_ASM_000599